MFYLLLYFLGFIFTMSSITGTLPIQHSFLNHTIILPCNAGFIFPCLDWFWQQLSNLQLETQIQQSGRKSLWWTEDRKCFKVALHVIVQILWQLQVEAVLPTGELLGVTLAGEDALCKGGQKVVLDSSEHVESQEVCIIDPEKCEWRPQSVLQCESWSTWRHPANTPEDSTSSEKRNLP